jgi:site-specific DNA-methyltransferase (adenine-specific)
MAEPETERPRHRPRLYRGDCLERLPDLLAEPERFDLIYADPPYNAGGVRAARTGSGLRKDGNAAYKDSWGGLDGFLAMMRPRVTLLRELLSERGTLWLHLDYRTVHDVKVLCDEVFGRPSFAGEIIWVPGNGGRRRSGPSVTHQTLLIYSKTSSFLYNLNAPELREPFAETSLKMHFNQVDADGRNYRERTLGGKTYRYYADEGRKLGSVWSDIPAMLANTPLKKETTGYPTQKPLRLLERIVTAASEPDSWVLDPMCGSGTTLEAARNLGRLGVGIDQSEVALATAKARLALDEVF